jgi:hypothetical protein
MRTAINSNANKRKRRRRKKVTISLFYAAKVSSEFLEKKFKEGEGIGANSPCL